MAGSQYSTGRFPKVSIGIRVEKLHKTGSEQSKKDDIALPTTIQLKKSIQLDYPRETSISKTVQNCNTKVKSRDQNASAKASKTSEFPERPIEAHVLPEQAPAVNPEKVIFKKLAAATSEGNQADRDEIASAWLSTKPEVHKTQKAETVHFFSKQASSKEQQDGMQKNAERLENISDNETMEETKVNNLQQTQVIDKSISREHEKGLSHDNETLRVKLWEILGAGSQSKQVLASPAHEETDAPNKKQREDNRDGTAKAMPNSDTIETDSESPNPTPQRPVTRSLTRKKNPSTSGKKIQNAKKSGKLPLSSSSSASKLKLADKSIFTFNEIEATGTRLSEHANGQTSSVKERSTKLKKARTEPRKIHFPVLNSDKTSLFNQNQQRVLSAEKESPRSQETEPSPCPPVMQEDKLITPNIVLNASKNIHQEDNRQEESSPLPSYAKTPECSDSWKLKTNRSKFMTRASWETHLENGVTPSVENTTPSFDLKSPTFAVNASTPSTRYKQLDDDIPTPETKRASDSDESYRPETVNPNTETESSIATGDSQELQATKLPYDLKYKETAKHPSLSPKEDEEYMREEGCLFTKGHKSSDKWFSDIGSLGQPTIKFYQRNTTPVQKSKKISNSNLSSSSPIGTSKTEETIGANEILDQLPEDSMERTVYQLALVLQRFKSKIKTQAGKISSEILSSIAEKVHLQLQDATSQIEANLDNFISTDQTKRKRLESRIQDQQKRLRLMYDKFKGEVNQNLEDCRSILDEFEAYQIELRGGADKQKVVQKKLLLQVENSIETQLNDAERKVVELNKDASRKMKQLKGILKEWIAECVTN